MDFSSLSAKPVALIGVLAMGGALSGYAIHEHNSAQKLAAENVQTTAALNQTQHQVGDLMAKVNALVSLNEAQRAAQTAAAAKPAAGTRSRAVRRPKEDPRFNKLQSQLDEQGKAIAQTRNDLAGTQGDLVNTRTELSGSIAHTHDELVVLQKRGERNYAEFDIAKSKEFKHTGPIAIRLKKANDKHQFADLELLVDDRNLSQKHVNLYQPLMFSTPDNPQPVEIVINDISKNHIHGYVAASKYKQSELASMSDTATGGTQANNPQPARKKLTLPQ
jgi:chromosome segregation ATPase